jgi:hypothetical protein
VEQGSRRVEGSCSRYLSSEGVATHLILTTPISFAPYARTLGTSAPCTRTHYTLRHAMSHPGYYCTPIHAHNFTYSLHLRTRSAPSQSFFTFPLKLYARSADTLCMTVTPVTYWTQKLELAQAQLATFQAWDACNPMKLTCVSFAMRDLDEAKQKLASAEHTEAAKAKAEAFNTLPWYKKLFRSA